MPKLKIDYETLDGIVVASLKKTIKLTKKHGDDPEDDQKLIEAAERLIRHHTPYR